MRRKRFWYNSMEMAQRSVGASYKWPGSPKMIKSITRSCFFFSISNFISWGRIFAVATLGAEDENPFVKPGDRK